MFLTGLTEREVYEFEVAAESSVGVGEFSEPSPAAKLEDDRILYYIIGCVVCGVLLVVVGIVIVAIFAYGKQRYNQRKKTIKINSSGNHAFLPEDTDNGMPLKSPTVDRHHSRDTLTSTSNGYFNSSFHATSITKSDSYSRDGLSPPTYNQIGEFPVTNGGMTSPIGIKMDTVIDMPENSTQIQTHFVGGKVAQNPQYNVHVLGHQQQQHSPRPAHMQLTLQTSLSDIQHHVDSPTPDKAMGSLSSERQFLSNSHLLSVHAPVLSRSNPTIGTRYPCDSVVLPGPTSQATDV